MEMRTEAKGWSKTIPKKIILGQRTGFLCKTKNSFQRNIWYYDIHYIEFESTLEVYFSRVSRKTFIGKAWGFTKNRLRHRLEKYIPR